MRQFNMLCDLIRSNQSQQMPFAGNPFYNAQGTSAPQQPHIPFSQPDARSNYPPQQSYLPFHYPNSSSMYPQQLYLPFRHPDSPSILPPQQSHLPFSQPTASTQGMKASPHLKIPFSETSTSSASTHLPMHAVHEQPTYHQLNPVTFQNTSGPEDT